MSKENKMRGYRNMLGLTQEKLGKNLVYLSRVITTKKVGRHNFQIKKNLRLKIF